MGAPGQFSGSPQPTPPHSTTLQSALKRLDPLVDWERRRRTGPPGSCRLMRVDSRPAHDLLLRLGSPHKRISAVHVTGSKGKGTVAALISTALQLSPFSRKARVDLSSPSSLASPPQLPVGTYSSPHVERISERVRLNGIPVSDDALAVSLHATLDARLREPQLQSATWFDVLTAAGLHAFASAGATRAVIEVGMGGRLDSTNVLDAPVSVVTNIHPEHVEIIGPTMEDIAYEKAGVIAAGADVVVGLAETHELAWIFRAEADTKSPPARVQFIPPHKAETIQRTNLRLARAALVALAARERLDVRDMAVILTDERAQATINALPARQEMFMVAASQHGKAAVPVMLDGAHVAASVAAVLDEAPWRRPVIVIGLGRDKQIADIASAIASRAQRVFATTIGDSEVYTSAEVTTKALKIAGVVGCECVPDAADALERAVAEGAQLGTGVVVIGSLHLAGRLRPVLRQLSTQRHDQHVDNSL